MARSFLSQPDPAQPDGAARTAEPRKPARRGRPPIDVAIQRRRILDAAAAVFSAQGFAQASIDAISREAGVTKRTIYALVGDKPALFRAVCNGSAPSVANLPFPEARPGAPLRDTLATLTCALLNYALSPPLVALSRMIMIESTQFPDLVEDILDSGREVIHDGIKSVFRGIEDDGLASFADLDWAAETFYDVVVGNRGFRAAIGFQEVFPSDDEIGRRIDLFVSGYFQAVGTG